MQEDSFPSHYQELRWSWLACRFPNLPSWFSWRVYFLSSSLLECLNLPGHSKINTSGPTTSLASSLNTCNLPGSQPSGKVHPNLVLHHQVPDFSSSLRGLKFLHACFTGSDWCKGSTEYLSLLHVIGHQLLCPISQQAHPLMFMFLKTPFLLFCLEGWETIPEQMAALAPQSTCPLPHSQCSPGTSRGNKEKVFIAQGGSAQESKLIFLAYALCSGRQHTAHVLLFKTFISLCILLQFLYKYVML